MFHPTLKIKIYQEDLVFGPGLVILMKRYRQMEEETRDCLQKSFEKYFPEYQRIR